MPEVIKKSTMPKVTVLMAVYNAADFLPESLGSLLRQTHRDLQIVCIDDASTDQSLKLLKEYAARDSRIEVLCLDENHGQAYARNQGLQQARGELTCMLDADDWLDDDAIEQAVVRFTDDVDVVLFDVMMDYADRTVHYDMPQPARMSGEQAFRLSLTWTIHGLYMVRTAIHQRHPYDTTCRLYSDDNTTRLHYLNARQVACCNGVYHYRQHAASMTHQVSVRRFDYLRANESMRSQLIDAGVSRHVLGIYESHRWLNLVGVYMFYHVHGHELPAADCAYGLAELHRVWLSMERDLIPVHFRRKPGYRMMPTWTLFRIQEWLYFTIRGFFGKNE